MSLSTSSLRDEPVRATKLWLLGWVVFLTFAYGWVWIWQGLDVTDEGFNLTNQLLLRHGNARYVYSVIWFSDAANAVWLILAGETLCGERLGWVLGMSLAAATAFLILASHFPPRTSASAVLLAHLVINSERLMAIDYNLVPVLLVLLGVGALLAAQRQGSGHWERRGLMLLSGVLLFLSSMAKITYVPALVLPWTSVGLRWIVRGKKFDDLGANPFLAALGMGLAAVACAMFLASQQRLSEYLGCFTGRTELGLNASYSPQALFLQYAAEGLPAAKYSLVLVIAAAAASWAAQAAAGRIGNRNLGPALLFGIVAIAVLGLTTLWFGLELSIHLFHLVIPSLIVGLAVWCAADFFLESRSDAFKQSNVELAVVAVALSLLAMAGSATGLRHLLTGSWLSFPLVILRLPEAMARFWSYVQKRPCQPNLLRPYVAAIALSLGCYAVGIRCNSPYRDLRDRTLLTTTVNDPKLQSIHTSPARAESMQALLDALRPRVRAGDEILAYNSIPMVYFLTETAPVLETPWPELLNRQSLVARLNQLGHKTSLPEIAVRAKTGTTDRAWGVKPAEQTQHWGSENVALIDATLQELGYHEIWSNDDFVIFEKP